MCLWHQQRAPNNEHQNEQTNECAEKKNPKLSNNPNTKRNCERKNVLPLEIAVHPKIIIVTSGALDRQSEWSASSGVSNYGNHDKVEEE